MPIDRDYLLNSSHPELTIPISAFGEITRRSQAQEAVYGHNTGHFTLSVEKRNTLTGVAGEWLAATALRVLLVDSGVDVALSPIGHSADLLLTSREGRVASIHVKAGVWREWPGAANEFGIHADQGIATGVAPVILVTFLRSGGHMPSRGRVEGFVTPAFLRGQPRIREGELFPHNGWVSRTDNIVTRFGDYRPLAELLPMLFATLGIAPVKR